MIFIHSLISLKLKKIDYYVLYDKMIELPKDYFRNLYLVNDGHPKENGAQFFSQFIFEILSRNYHTF